MCGIIGVISRSATVTPEDIIKSLKILSYRGYDSAGYALKEGDKILVEKRVGSVDKLRKITCKEAKVGIGHTRWATHGGIYKKNAHPHLDCNEKIAVVHNGIINNYRDLKEQLINSGHKFKSDTDTEVIPHLIEENLKKYKKEGDRFLLAFRDTIGSLRGNYAILAIWNEEDKIYAARNNNPLITSVSGGDKQIIASDVPSLVTHFEDGNIEYMPLENENICILEDSHVSVFDYNLEELKIEKYRYPYKYEDVSKGKYKYFIEKEINEQPKALKNTWEEFKENIKVVKGLAKIKSKISKIFITGCGSSFYAGMVGKVLLEKLLEIPTEVIISSEFRFFADKVVDDDSLLILVSQSGETYDTFSVLQNILKNNKGKRKPSVLAITNIPHSSLERIINKNGKNLPYSGIIRIGAGPEISVVATKTFTSQSYLFTLIAGYLKGEDDYKRICEVEIWNKAEKVLRGNNEVINEIAENYRRGAGFFVIGKEITLPISLEGALKLKEICYMRAEGIAGGELKHGSLAVINRKAPTIIVFPPPDRKEIWNSLLNNMMEIKARNGPVISVGFENDEEVKKESNYFISVPMADWEFSPVLEIIPLQILAYNIALKRRHDPDHPRNLAKTVTVE